MRLAYLAFFFTLLVACKQGEGESCQIDSDCAGSLVCSRNLRVCVADPGEETDAAATGIDAAPADAWPIDGGPDAMPDAMPPPADAMPDALL